MGYRVVSADGHPITGLLNFSVGSGPAATVGAVVSSTGASSYDSLTEGETAAAVAEPAGSFSWWLIAAAVGAAIVIAAGVAAMRLRGRSSANS